MRAVATRAVSVTTSPTNIRGTNLLPVTLSKIRYESGGGTIELVPLSSSAFGDGETVPAGAEFEDLDQSIARYAVSSTGTVSVRVTDFQA